MRHEKSSDFANYRQNPCPGGLFYDLLVTRARSVLGRSRYGWSGLEITGPWGSTFNDWRVHGRNKQVTRDANVSEDVYKGIVEIWHSEKDNQNENKRTKGKQGKKHTLGWSIEVQL